MVARVTGNRPTSGFCSPGFDVWLFNMIQWFTSLWAPFGPGGCGRSQPRP
jgi:hypothetical protein